jgi:hypothetical protein
MSSPRVDSHPVTVDSSPGFDSHPVTPPPRAAQEQVGPALDDSRDEYCIIKYVKKSGKKYKGKKSTYWYLVVTQVPT